MRGTGATPLYVDCNAIAPETARQVAEIVEGAGAGFVDAGIIGPPPQARRDVDHAFLCLGRGTPPTSRSSGTMVWRYG